MKSIFLICFTTSPVFRKKFILAQDIGAGCAHESHCCTQLISRRTLRMLARSCSGVEIVRPELFQSSTSPPPITPAPSGLPLGGSTKCAIAVASIWLCDPASRVPISSSCWRLQKRNLDNSRFGDRDPLYSRTTPGVTIYIFIIPTPSLIQFV